MSSCPEVVVATFPKASSEWARDCDLPGIGRVANAVETNNWSSTAQILICVGSTNDRRTCPGCESRFLFGVFKALLLQLASFLPSSQVVVNDKCWHLSIAIVIVPESEPRWMVTFAPRANGSLGTYSSIELAKYA